MRFLVHMANLQGGPDNTTVIVGKASAASRARPGMDTVQCGRRVPKFRGLRPDRAALRPGDVLPRQGPLALRHDGIGHRGLGGIAIALSLLEVGGGLYAFVGAGFLLILGILLMMVQNFHETRKIARTPEEPPLAGFTARPPVPARRFHL